MKASVLLLASAAPARTSRLARTPHLPLDFFIHRASSLALYRQFIRATRSLGDVDARWETVQWVRKDFERYRGMVDSEKSKTLLALGQRQLKQLHATGSLIGGDSAKWRGRRSAM
ncbi:hypothetical protein JCM9279_002056 [Rhodotorula babjevae]